MGLFRKCHYDHENKNITFEFEEMIAPYLRELSGNFTKYQVDQIKKLTSRYAIRLYEILRKLHPLSTKKKESAQTISFEILKKMLGCDTPSYRNYAYFRKSVLDLAQKQLSETTDLGFEFEPIRQGRKIASIKFTVCNNIHNNHKNHHDHEAETLPKGYNAAISSIIKSYIPELSDEIVTFLASKIHPTAVTRTLLAYKNKVDSGINILDPSAYFSAILQKCVINKQALIDEHLTSKKSYFSTKEAFKPLNLKYLFNVVDE